MNGARSVLMAQSIDQLWSPRETPLVAAHAQARRRHVEKLEHDTR
jgi:hypothetical protein